MIHGAHLNFPLNKFVWFFAGEFPTMKINLDVIHKTCEESWSWREVLLTAGC